LFTAAMAMLATYERRGVAHVTTPHALRNAERAYLAKRLHLLGRPNILFSAIFKN